MPTYTQYKNVPTGTTPSGQTIYSSGAVDPKTLANFSAANPNLTPTPTDLAVMGGASPSILSSPLPNPTPAANLSSTKAPELPTPTAPDVHAQYFAGVTSNVASARAALDKSIADNEAKVKAAQDQTDQQQKMITGQEANLATPFRTSLETASAPTVNKNLDAAQSLVDEMDSLAREATTALTSSGKFATLNAASKASTTTLSDISARMGVLQAAISAHYGQVGQIDTQIDRAVTATNADRQDELDYYNTLLDLNKSKQLSLDDESRTLAETKANELSSDLDNATKTADALKSAMLDPNTAMTYAQAGVTLNDTPQQIQKKLADYGYSQEVTDMNNQMAAKGYVALVPGQTPPAGAQVVKQTDSRGNVKSFYMPAGSNVQTKTYTYGGKVYTYQVDANGNPISAPTEVAAAAQPATISVNGQKVNINPPANTHAQDATPPAWFAQQVQQSTSSSVPPDTIQKAWDSFKQANAPAQSPLSSTELQQAIWAQIGTPDFQALSPADRKLYIESQGGNPSDYGY